MRSQSLPVSGPSAAVAQISSQRRLLSQVEPMRLISSAVAFGLMALFVPPWLAMAAMGLDLLCEGIAFSLMRGLDPAQSRWRYRLVLGLVFLMELAYTVPCLMIWQQHLPFAKALAVGLVSMTLFQLTTVRAIHLPFGMAGWLAVAATTLLGNGWYWLSHDDLAGFTVSTLGVIGAIIYTLGAMRSNHALHLEISRRGDEADAGNRAKGLFLAQMSHELRTPLNAILGMGEAELASTDDPGTKDRMQTLVASARGLALMLDDILEMSGLDETGLPIRPVTSA
ncbi:MAG: Sensor protein, partial [uncultured bacterium]